MIPNDDETLAEPPPHVRPDHSGSPDPIPQALEAVIAERGFYMYVAGTALVTCSRFGLLGPASNDVTSTDVSGLTVENDLMTLPLKKGLSSSAAVCVLVVKALCLVYGLELSVSQVSFQLAVAMMLRQHKQ